MEYWYSTVGELAKWGDYRSPDRIAAGHYESAGTTVRIDWHRKKIRPSKGSNLEKSAKCSSRHRL